MMKKVGYFLEKNGLHLIDFTTWETFNDDFFIRRYYKGSKEYKGVFLVRMAYYNNTGMLESA